MSEIELLPCPFCGSSAVITARPGTGRQSCIVECENCGCRLESNENGSGDAWNQRAAITWTGTPIYKSAAAFRDQIDEPQSRIFHRDYPGRIVAVFHGEGARRNGNLFCEMFGEADGSPCPVTNDP